MSALRAWTKGRSLRRSRSSATNPKSRSTWFSQDELVGVKCMWPGVSSCRAGFCGFGSCRRSGGPRGIYFGRWPRNGRPRPPSNSAAKARSGTNAHRSGQLFATPFKHSSHDSPDLVDTLVLQWRLFVSSRRFRRAFIDYRVNSPPGHRLQHQPNELRPGPTASL
jgi:hypothetical protein